MLIHSGLVLGPMDIVRELAALPRRGATVERQPFTTPETYIPESR